MADTNKWKQEIAVFKTVTQQSSLPQPDFTIAIKGYEWKVHSQVISSQSAFFDKICNAPFKESMDKRVELHDDCPFMISRLIQYFYTDQVDETSDKMMMTTKQMMRAGKTAVLQPDDSTKDQANADYEQAAQFYLLADKYGIPTLSAKSRFNLAKAVYMGYACVPTIVDLIGILRMKNDLGLCKTLFEAVLEDEQCPKSVMDDICEAFASEPAIVELAWDTFFRRWEAMVEESTTAISDIQAILAGPEEMAFAVRVQLTTTKDKLMPDWRTTFSMT